VATPSGEAVHASGQIIGRGETGRALSLRRLGGSEADAHLGPAASAGVPPSPAASRLVNTTADCRVDAWLWRARFFKSRSLAAQFVEDGRVRLSRGTAVSRLDKASRAVKPGDGLVFALSGRVVAIRIEALGERRGPASEARNLYSVMETHPPKPQNGGASEGQD
jgi:ribosomal 50S subunit-recycling heat shock protein